MYTYDMLNRLKAAYARGVQRVREGDTWVEYQSMSHMRQAIADIEAELQRGNKKRPQGVKLVNIRGTR